MNYFSLFLNLLNMTVENAAPYLLITIGGVFVARAGVFNISMEGCTEFAAFAGILFAFVTGQIWVGVFAQLPVLSLHRQAQGQPQRGRQRHQPDGRLYSGLPSAGALRHAQQPRRQQYH